MRKKKGLFALFVILLSFSFYSALAFDKHQAITLRFDDADCDDWTVALMNDVQESKDWEPDSSSCGPGDYSGTTGNVGCDLLILNDGPLTADECAQFRAKNMFVLESNNGLYKNFDLATGDVSIEGNDDDAQCFNNIKWRSNLNNSYLCAYDSKDKRHYWFTCDASVVKQTYNLTIVGDKNQKEIQKFICLLTTEVGYIWKNINEIDVSVDADEDGVPDELDCAPNNKTIFPQFNCGPKLDKETGKKIIDKTTEEEIEECSVKGAPRVCGDSIDNDCSVNPGSPYTIEDDCDNDKEACESSCLGKGEKCSWADISDTESVCCGDDILNDLGKIVRDKDGNVRVCLNKKNVGSKTGKFEELWEEMNCLGEWCFVSASGSAKFEVFTIRQSNKVYDVVSNSEKWVSCTADVFTLDKPIFDGSEEVVYSKIVNRFRCYSDGDKWSWAECVGKLKGSHNEVDGTKTIKARYAGDALVSLQLANANPEGIVYKESVELNMNSPDYKNFYANNNYKCFYEIFGSLNY